MVSPIESLILELHKDGKKVAEIPVVELERMPIKQYNCFIKVQEELGRDFIFVHKRTKQQSEVPAEIFYKELWSRWLYGRFKEFTEHEPYSHEPSD